MSSRNNVNPCVLNAFVHSKRSGAKKENTKGAFRDIQSHAVYDIPGAMASGTLAPLEPTYHRRDHGTTVQCKKMKIITKTYTIPSGVSVYGLQ